MIEKGFEGTKDIAGQSARRIGNRQLRTYHTNYTFIFEKKHIKKHIKTSVTTSWGECRYQSVTAVSFDRQ